jgi:putative ABC transport system permease protein
MLGEFLIRSNKVGPQTLRALLGSIIYRAMMYLARNYGYHIGMSPNDLNLVTGLLIIVCIMVSRNRIFRPKTSREKNKIGKIGGERR